MLLKKTFIFLIILASITSAFAQRGGAKRIYTCEKLVSLNLAFSSSIIISGDELLSQAGISNIGTQLNSVIFITEAVSTATFFFNYNKETTLGFLKGDEKILHSTLRYNRNRTRKESSPASIEINLRPHHFVLGSLPQTVEVANERTLEIAGDNLSLEHLEFFISGEGYLVSATINLTGSICKNN